MDCVVIHWIFEKYYPRLFPPPPPLAVFKQIESSVFIATEEGCSSSKIRGGRKVFTALVSKSPNPQGNEENWQRRSMWETHHKRPQNFCFSLEKVFLAWWRGRGDGGEVRTAEANAGPSCRPCPGFPRL